MCGIFGTISSGPVHTLVVDGLRRLDYRGYDACGVAWQTPAAELRVVRSVGAVDALTEKLACEARPTEGTVAAISHTRWATHGSPLLENTHPHLDCSGKLAIVHNGVIENHSALRKALRARGHTIRSETDSELIAHLLEEKRAAGKPLATAVRLLHMELTGDWALAVIEAKIDVVAEIVASRSGSPLVIGKGNDSMFLSSDAQGLPTSVRMFVDLADGDVAVMTRSKVELFDRSGNCVERKEEPVLREDDSAKTADFPHRMRAEMQEQVDVIGRLQTGSLADDSSLQTEQLSMLRSEHPPQAFVLVACGSSFHAASASAAFLHGTTGIPVDVLLASDATEFLQETATENTWAIGISQSGETADTLRALRAFRAKGAATIALCNVGGSTMARECDVALPLLAGPERAVASTKAFTSQLVGLKGFAARVARLQSPDQTPHTDDAEYANAVRTALSYEDDVRTLVSSWRDARAVLFLSRGPLVPIAREGALKLQELSYIPALAFPAGELKHGPLALVDDKVPTVLVVPPGELGQRCWTTASEILARSGSVVAIAQTPPPEVPLGLSVIDASRIPDRAFAVFAAVIMQLIGYHVALRLNRPIDRPRNLAKSVTVA